MESAYSRYGDDFHIGASVAFHLIDKWCHTIDAGVSARDDTYGVALFGIFESHLSTLPFFLHASVDADGVFGNILFDKLEIVFISDHHTAVCHGIQQCGSNVFRRAGSDARHIYSHISP